MPLQKLDAKHRVGCFLGNLLEASFPLVPTGGHRSPDGDYFWFQIPLDISVISVITEITDMVQLSAAKKRFILHWGEMGARWGINRTVAQAHALLHVSSTPLTAEEIATMLSVARSNVSTSIRELQGWGLVRTVHEIGDRRQHFESIKDVWEMFRIIIDQRKRREIDPTIDLLRLCISELRDGNPEDAYTKERLQEIYEFFTDVETLYTDIRQFPVSTLRRLVKARGAVRKLLSLKTGR
jgi:DNA-binding transcriptional regulator GbsR (MarR family)